MAGDGADKIPNGEKGDEDAHEINGDGCDEDEEGAGFVAAVFVSGVARAERTACS